MCVMFQPDVVWEFGDHRQAGFLSLSGSPHPPGPQQKLQLSREKRWAQWAKLGSQRPGSGSGLAAHKVQGVLC